MHWQTHWLAVLALALTSARAQDQSFVTGLGGFAILSGAAQTDFREMARASSYRAETGAALNLGGGRHVNDWISVQGNYIWNRNQVFLSGTQDSGFVETKNGSQQHQVIADGLLYFRPLRSRIRPYLSFGLGAVHASRTTEAITASRPPYEVAPPSASEWYTGIRVAVGIDLLWKHGWGFRYSFSETITPNIYGEGLRPPASGRLMNFQNLFGFVRYF